MENSRPGGTTLFSSQRVRTSFYSFCLSFDEIRYAQRPIVILPKLKIFLSQGHSYRHVSDAKVVLFNAENLSSLNDFSHSKSPVSFASTCLELAASPPALSLFWTRCASSSALRDCIQKSWWQLEEEFNILLSTRRTLLERWDCLCIERPAGTTLWIYAPSP